MELDLEASVITENTVVLPSASDLTLEEAQLLDQEIDEHLEGCDRLLRHYLEAGHRLARMQETKAYTALGYHTLKDYLASKKRFGRTYWSFLLKVGKGGDPQRFIELGMHPGVLIEYARLIGRPEKLHELVDATWGDVKDLPPKEAGKTLKQFLEIHGEEFSKPRKRRTSQIAVLASAELPVEGGGNLDVKAEANESAIASDYPIQPPDWESHFFTHYSGLPADDRDRFVRGMKDFLAGLE